MKYLEEELLTAQQDSKLFDAICSRTYPLLEAKRESVEKLFALRDDSYRRLQFLEILWPAEASGLPLIGSRRDNPPAFFTDQSLSLTSADATKEKARYQRHAAAYFVRLRELVGFLARRERMPK